MFERQIRRSSYLSVRKFQFSSRFWCAVSIQSQKKGQIPHWTLPKPLTSTRRKAKTSVGPLAENYAVLFLQRWGETRIGDNWSPVESYNRMKKQEVKSLEDQFSHLFKNQPHQQSLNENSETYLLDSAEAPAQFNGVTFKQVPLTESESEEDFLDQVDDILGHGEENQQQLTRREIMLNFKVNELKLMCKNLKLANSKLAERVDELERPRSEIISENSVEVNRTQDLTMMQQEFSEIEEELKSYKSQLAKYQQTNSQQLQAKRDEINRYKNELEDARMEAEDLMRELKEKNRIISLLENKNEELLLLVEELESDKEREDDYYMGRGRSRRDNNFNDKISSEMENMIDKLVKELKYEKRNSAKQIAEIKRLNGEVLDLENKIKEKNNKIYELEMNLIKQAKQQPSLKERSPIKYEKYDKYENQSSHSYKQDEPLNSYLPQRNNNFIQAFRQDPDIPYKDVPTSKNKSHLTNKSYNKNRVSAEREGAPNARTSINKPTSYGSMPLNKLYSTFTLMDLLNKEFKIRQAQKYVIACRIIDVYSKKVMQQNFDNLISEQIEIYNFSPQNLAGIKVKINTLSKNDNFETNEESMLYNMAFILDTLLNQVEVVDAYLGNHIELNISDYIELVMSKNSKEEKYKLLQELANSIEREFISH